MWGRHPGVRGSASPALSFIRSLAPPSFPYFLQTHQTHSQLQIFANCFLSTFYPFLNHQARLSFHPLHVQILPTFKAHGMGPPPPTSSFFPSACWVSLHCGIELSGLYHLTLCKQIQCLVIQGLKTLFYVALLLDMLNFYHKVLEL